MTYSLKVNNKANSSTQGEKINKIEKRTQTEPNTKNYYYYYYYYYY
jgi:hypothetical protein